MALSVSANGHHKMLLMVWTQANTSKRVIVVGTEAYL